MIIQPRRSLAALEGLDADCGLLLVDSRFDMGRRIDVEDPEFAIKFAYLEHIVRLTTPAAEARSAAQQLSPDLAETMTALVDGKDSLFQEAFSFLQENITEAQLAEMEVPDLALHLLFPSEGKIKEREVIATGHMRLPLVYVAVLEEACIILYTTFMTFVDGFNASTGQRINPVLSSELIDSLALEMYWREEGTGIMTQTEPSPQLHPHSSALPKPALPSPKAKAKAAAASIRPSKPRAELKAMVVEWRSLDLKAKQQHSSREACQGLTCSLQ